jgi:hypothetical protein
VFALLAGLVWANTIYIGKNPVEKNFLPPWLGLRTFLEFGNDPYGEPAAQRAQVLFYGKLAEGGQDPLILNQPFASEILFFPLALINDYTTARLVWMVLLELVLIGSAFLCLNLFEWRLPIILIPVYVVVAICGAQALLPLFQNSPVILISSFLMVGLIGLRKGLDELAGAAFALAIFQPTVTGIFCLMTLWWVIKNHRWRVIWGGLMAGGFLFISSFTLLPGWFMPFIRSFRSEFEFKSYQSTYVILTKLWPAIGNKVAAALTIGLVIILILEWRATRHEDFRWFLWTASLTLATYSLVGIPTLAVNNIVLLIPLTYILKILSERMGGKKRWMLIVLLLGLIFVGGWAITLGMQKIKDEVAPNLISLFVSPLLLVAGLYWIRWWATSPPRTWMDTIEWDFK